MPCGTSSPLQQRLLLEAEPEVWWPLFLQACRELNLPPEQLVGKQTVNYAEHCERLMPSLAMRERAWTGLHTKLHEVENPGTFARALAAGLSTASTLPAIGQTTEPLAWAAQLKRRYDALRR